MSFKDELLKLKSSLLSTNIEEPEKTVDSYISLDTLIEAFVNWYHDTFVKQRYSEIGDMRIASEMRDFIEKVAVWYELRYPDYEINKLMYCSGEEAIDINSVMFRNNEYLHSMLGDNPGLRHLDWGKYYNKEAFINSLPWSKRYYFNKPKYNSIIYISPAKSNAHLHVDEDGFIELAENITKYSDGHIKDSELKGKHVTYALSLFKSRRIDLPKINELESSINTYNLYIDFHNKLIDAITCRIIDRGGARFGPRRGLLFAKEFEGDIDLPMKYAIDYSDPGLRQFINEYLRLGGNPDLECYNDYFSVIDRSNIGLVSIRELLRTIGDKPYSFYTKDENILHQRLVDVLSSNIDADKLKKEEVKQLRIQRRLNKNKKH